ncbi:MAG: hypothetical protein DYG89_17175 [Caldilinea sp. CFX5]|nr:hypothetical protein [Caldilinea sp. CFX5]
MSKVRQDYAWLKRWAALVMAVWALLIVAPAYAQQVDQVIAEDSANGSISFQRVTVDGAGNRYVTGRFSGDVLFGEGANSQQLNGTDDLFVAKYNVMGTLVWVKEFESDFGGGGIPGVTPTGIAADVTTNGLYLGGHFVNALNAGGPVLLSNDSNADGFIARLNLVTGATEWANQIRGTKVILVNDLVDARGNVAITGRFQGAAEFIGTFNTGKNLLTETVNGDDMFVAAYSQVGQLIFAQKAGGGGAEGHSLRFKSGTIMVVGEFRGTARFPDRLKPAQLTAVGGSDGFVASYFDNGDLKFVKQIGSAGSESALRVVQGGTHFYVAGAFENTLTIGTTALTSRGQRDLFLVKYSMFDGAINGVTQIGGDGLDFLTGLASDAKGVGESVYVTGEFRGAQLTVGAGSGTIQLPNGNGGNATAFITGLNANFAPSFGQTVQGKFEQSRLTAELDGTLHLVGGHRSAVTFGSGDRVITIPAPAASSGLALARFRPNGFVANPKLLYVSPTGVGKVSGIAFDGKDMLAFDPATNKWSLLIDGSDIVLGGTDIDAFEWRSDQTVLMSFNVNTTLPGVGAVTDKDIVRFIPTSLGATTAGGFEMFMNGSAVGLDAGDENEDIDGITITPEGHLVLSTVGPVSANGGLSANGADLLRVESNRTLSLYLEGADLGLLPPGENAAALSVDVDGVHLGMAGAFDINGVNSQGQPITLAGDGNDVVTCLPEALGSDVKVSACTLRFDGGANGLGTLSIDNIAVGRSGMAGTDFSDEEENTTPEDPGGVEGAARIFLPLVTR